MKTIEYRADYTNADADTLRVTARDINSGYAKALKLAREPLGNGTVRQIASLSFWQIIR